MKLGTRLVKTGDLGLGGNLYGGRLLEWMAEQGALCAMELANEGHMVGYRFDEVVLSRPVKGGERLTFHATEIRFGTSSVVFRLRGLVGSEESLTALCVFVAVDAAGNKKSLSPELRNTRFGD